MASLDDYRSYYEYRREQNQDQWVPPDQKMYLAELKYRPPQEDQIAVDEGIF